MRTGWVRQNTVSGTVAAKCSREALHESMRAEFARGIAEGVPVAMLDGFAAMRSLSRLVVVNERQSQLTAMRKELDTLGRRARRAREMAADEDEAGEVTTAEDYRADARRLRRKQDALAAQIERIETTIDPARQLGEQFTGEVDFLLAGLRVLCLKQAQMSRDDQSALHRVLHEPRFVVTDDWVTWHAGLLIAIDNNVAVLGPFSGRVPNISRVATPAQQRRRAAPMDAPRQRRLLKQTLQAKGMPEPLARAAVLAPGGHLPRVLLGEDVIWPDCDDEYDHAAFNAHLREAWRFDLRWSARNYVYPNPKRQTLTDLVAALGGHARLDQVHAVCDELGIKATDLPMMTLPRPPMPGRPPFPPSVTRTNTWHVGSLASDSLMKSVLCPLCHEPATAVARVLEIPGSLLCRSCLVAPSRPDLRFPPSYLELALPEVHFSDAMLAKARAGRRTRKGPPKGQPQRRRSPR